MRSDADDYDHEDPLLLSSPPSARRGLTTEESEVLVTALNQAMLRSGRLGNFSLERGYLKFTSPLGEKVIELPIWAYAVTRMSEVDLRASSLSLVRELNRDQAPSSRAPTPHSNLTYLPALAALLFLGGGAYVLYQSTLSPDTPPRARETRAQPVVASAATAPPSQVSSSCAELRRQATSKSGANQDGEKRLEAELLLVQIGPGEPLDALEGFRSRVVTNERGVTLREWSTEQKLSGAKLERSQWKARGLTARTLAFRFPQGSYSALKASPKLLDTLPEFLTELAISFATITSRCSGGGAPIHSLWFYADSNPHLLAAIAQSDVQSETPWTAEPFLHPPSETTTNPLFAFLNTSERAETAKLDLQSLRLGDDVHIEKHPLATTLFTGRESPADFLTNVRKTLVQLGVAKPR